MREKTMTDLLSRFDSEQLIGLVAVSGGLLCGLIAIVGGFWLQIRKAEIGAALKQDMLNRGMSADEIRTVLDAGSSVAPRSNADKHSCGV
jgi:hypothetical protein